MGFPNIWNLIPRPNLTHLATYICVYMCVCICACVHTHVRGRIYIYTRVHTCMGAHTHTHTRMYTCIQHIVSHKNYRGISLTSIAVKIYNALLRNRIELKIEKILRKNQNAFPRNRFTTLQILTIRRILDVRTKNLDATILFVDFAKAFDSIHKGKMEQILLSHGLPKETVAK